MLNEPQGFGPWMKADTQGKRTSRWVEFLSEICNEGEDSNPEPTKSPPSAVVDEVEHGMNSDETGKHIISSDALGTRTDQFPTNFESLAARVTSDPVHLEKIINFHNQSQPDSHVKFKESNPISTCLVQTTLNSLTPMEIEQKENLNHPPYSQPILNQTQNPKNIESQYASNLDNSNPKLDPPTQPSNNHCQKHPDTPNPLPYPTESSQPKTLEFPNPSNVVGLSKAQLKGLAWIAFFNEAEESMVNKPSGLRELEEIIEVDPGPIALSLKPTETYQLSISGKRKGEEMDGPTLNKALKLSKIRSGDIVKINWANSGSNSGEIQKSETLVEPERDMGKQKKERKKLKARARESRGSARARFSSMEEEVEASTGNFPKSKMAEEAGLTMPPTQP
nr:hypothetical protein CFP56_48270 [Quercus suber]